MDQYTLFKDILMFYNTFFPLSYVLVKFKKKDITNALKDGKQNIKPHNLDDGRCTIKLFVMDYPVYYN